MPAVLLITLAALAPPAAPDPCRLKAAHEYSTDPAARHAHDRYSAAKG